MSFWWIPFYLNGLSMINIEFVNYIYNCSFYCPLKYKIISYFVVLSSFIFFIPLSETPCPFQGHGGPESIPADTGPQPGSSQGWHKDTNNQSRACFYPQTIENDQPAQHVFGLWQYLREPRQTGGEHDNTALPCYSYKIYWMINTFICKLLD